MSLSEGVSASAVEMRISDNVTIISLIMGGGRHNVILSSAERDIHVWPGSLLRIVSE